MRAPREEAARLAQLHALEYRAADAKAPAAKRVQPNPLCDDVPARHVRCQGEPGAPGECLDVLELDEGDLALGVAVAAQAGVLHRRRALQGLHRGAVLVRDEDMNDRRRLQASLRRKKTTRSVSSKPSARCTTWLMEFSSTASEASSRQPAPCAHSHTLATREAAIPLRRACGTT